MRVAMGMAPPRTVFQGWLELFTISPTYYTPSNWAVVRPTIVPAYATPAQETDDVGESEAAECR